jgi:hypothetical protein
MVEVVLPFGFNSYSQTSMLRLIWSHGEILTTLINILPPINLKTESKRSGRPIRVIERRYAQLLLLSSTPPPILLSMMPRTFTLKQGQVLRRSFRS